MSLFHRSISGILLALALVGAACAKQAPPPSGSPSVAQAAFPLTLTDDDGVAVTLDARPARIVTFAPSLTEVVYALGLGDELVGVSGAYDDYPAAAKDVAEIGGAGDFGADPNIESVVALQPDLMLTISGGEQWKQQLRQNGIPVFTLNATSLPDAIHDIQTVGRLTGAGPAAAHVTADMQRQADAIQARVANEAPTTCFFDEGFSSGVVYTVGPGSFIYDLLRRAGCRPVTSGAKDAYPQWSLESLLHEDPQVYLVSSEAGTSAAAITRRPGYSALSSVRDGRVVLIDSDLVSRPGPRVVQGLAALVAALHPASTG